MKYRTNPTPCRTGRSAIARKWHTTVAIFLVALAAGFSLFAPAALAETRVALVIGNGGYSQGPLKNPRNDAGLMSRSLAAAGFDVLTIMDGSQEDIRAAIASFERRLSAPDAVALFYFAGHGVQSRGDNYLIPVGTTIREEQDLVEQAVPLQAVFQAMERAASRMNIVILDACRTNPFEGAGGGRTMDGLAQVVAPAGTIIGYATAPGQVARDGAGDNSPYTQALAAAIPVPGATLDDVFRSARRVVRETTSGRQTPWEHSSLVGTFYFVAEPAPVLAELPLGALATDSGLAEIEAWQKIKSSQNGADFERHLKTYPVGYFAELAAVRLAAIEAARAMLPWTMVVTIGADPVAEAAAASAIYSKAVALDAGDASSGALQSAAQLYSEAAGLGSSDAMYRLGRAYDKGRGVSRDVVQAARWFALASTANHPTAMASLGTMNEYGEGVPRNLVEALRLYRLSADAGDPSGLANLAFLYSQGKGVARKVAEARHLYRRAADLGHTRAAFNLALMSLNGEGGRADTAEGIRWLEIAAAKPYSPALEQLAHLYDQGRGVTRDPVRAAELFLQAIQSSHRDGRKIDVASAPRSLATRREIQRRLADRGLYAGMKHGIFNVETRRGLVAFADL